MRFLFQQTIGRSVRLVFVLIGSLYLFQMGNPAALTHAARNFAAPDVFVQFSDSTRGAGLPLTPSRTYGMAWGDIDNDGWVDLFIGHHAYPPVLMHNEQDGTFRDITSLSGIAVPTDRHQCAWGDFNNDRLVDLYCSSGADRGTGAKPNQLWQNNGDGTFRDVAESMGVVDGPGRGRTVMWFDYNRDGLLDLFVGNQMSADAERASRLFRNDGTFFTDVAPQVKLGPQFPIVACALVDYNQDNLWDLSIASGKDLALFTQKTNGTFRQATPDQTGLAATKVHGLAWGDFDNDGYMDLYAAALDGKSKLFHNDHNGQFTDVTAQANLQTTNVFPEPNALWADFDNDGWLDLFVVRQGIGNAKNAPDVLWRNNGNNTFTDVTTFAKVAGPSAGTADAAATADYDNDGFPDLFVTNGKGAIGRGRLYHNLANQNHWLTIQLIGTHTNALAIGGKIRLNARGKTQYREYTYGSSSSGQSALPAHFGLGNATNIQSIRIRWADGQVQELTDVSADQHLVVQQP